MQIRCCTLFDITETGITGHFKPSLIPFRDRADQHITDLATWNRSRNQQRNLETITQVLQLRTQIFDVTQPVQTKGRWQFEFTVEFEGIYQQDQEMFVITLGAAEQGLQVQALFYFSQLTSERDNIFRRHIWNLILMLSSGKKTISSVLHAFA